MEQITADNFQTATNTEGLNVVMFSAPWCGSCVALKPQVKRFGESKQDVHIFEINVEENEEFAVSLGIKALPAFGFYKAGHQIELKSGYNYMSLKRRIEDLLN